MALTIVIITLIIVLVGPVTTASGLVIMTGMKDYYLRAMCIKTGRELWKARLPVGGETPMTYSEKMNDSMW